VEEDCQYSYNCLSENYSWQDRYAHPPKNYNLEKKAKWPRLLKEDVLKLFSEAIRSYARSHSRKVTMKSLQKLFLISMATVGVMASQLYLSAEKSGDYQVVKAWPQFREGFTWGEAAGVGVDSHNHVFVFHRADPPIVRLNAKTGEIQDSFGDGMFINAHGLEVDDQDNVWVTDTKTHQVYKFSHQGKLLLTVGEREVSGVDSTHLDQPTDVAVSPSGAFYVSDGYGNSRVVKFSAEGKFLFAWGEKGDAPGQFVLPHGITLDSQGRVYVADRSNARIQVFDAEGHFLNQWKTEKLGRPWGLEVADDGFLYVINGGDMTNEPSDFAEILKMNLQGSILERWSSFGPKNGQLSWGHDVAVGTDGSIYTVEVRYNLRAQKFTRK
jgi:peptidylamidoglycolate lyase